MSFIFFSRRSSPADYIRRRKDFLKDLFHFLLRRDNKTVLHYVCTGRTLHFKILFSFFIIAEDKSHEGRLLEMGNLHLKHSFNKFVIHF